MLTTHYITLCNMMNENKNTINQQMKVNNTINTYQLIKGISTIKGGIKVLEELGYNAEIICSAKETIKNINI